MLAIALSDGTILLIDSFTGKIAHQILAKIPQPVSLPDWSSNQPTDSSSAKTPTQSKLFWSSHLASVNTTRAQLQDSDSEATLDDLLGLNADVSKLLNAKANLPRPLAQLDIETSLPKLSTLPATGSDDDVFSTRNSIDSIFHPQTSNAPGQKASGDIIDVLLVNSNFCNLHIRIFDSFEIGAVDVAQALPKGLKGIRVLQQASHPLLSTHFFVLEAASDGPVPRSRAQSKEDNSFHVVSMDLRFIPQTSYNLTLVASKATQLQNLFRYVSQIQSQLSQEVRTAFDLPSRFLRNVNESLAEQDSSASFTTAAYHLAVTGQCDPRLKEWLVDEVGERGLKRWDKAVGDCLDLIRRMMSECLLPAIERCQVVVSRLDGLARFSESATRLGLDEKDIRCVRETLDVLTILCEDLLRDVCVEIREFAAFMRWFKWEAEVEALEEGSERCEEMRESYNGEAELHMVLDYISGAMQKSRVAAYIDVTKKEHSKGAKEDASESQLVENYKQARRRSSRNELPKFEEIVMTLKSRSEMVFSGIANTLRKNILCSYIGELTEPIDTAIMDCRVIHSGSSDDSYDVQIVGKSSTSDGDEMVVYVVAGTRQGPKLATLQKRRVPDGSGILDLQFVDDHGAFALVQAERDRKLLWQSVDGEEWETRYQFPQGVMTGGLKPSRLEVNGRKGQQIVTVLDESGMGFIVLSLDS